MQTIEPAASAGYQLPQSALCKGENLGAYSIARDDRADAL